MDLLDPKSEPPIVNVLEFLRSHGLDDHKAMQVILHLLLTETYAIATDARKAAEDLGIPLPYVLPGDDRTH